MENEKIAWKVFILPGVEKKIRKIQPDEQSRVKNKVLTLTNGISEADFRKLEGRPEWRLKVGRWRVLFRVDLINRTLIATDF